MIYGPYRSEYNNLSSANYSNNSFPPLILIATGGGGSYLIDFYNFIIKHEIKLKNPVFILYSSSSIALFQFVTNMICQKHIENYRVDAHITSHDDIPYFSDNESKFSRDMVLN